MTGREIRILTKRRDGQHSIRIVERGPGSSGGSPRSNYQKVGAISRPASGQPTLVGCLNPATSRNGQACSCAGARNAPSRLSTHAPLPGAGHRKSGLHLGELDRTVEVADSSEALRTLAQLLPRDPTIMTCRFGRPESLKLSYAWRKKTSEEPHESLSREGLREHMRFLCEAEVSNTLDYFMSFKPQCKGFCSNQGVEEIYGPYGPIVFPSRPGLPLEYLDCWLQEEITDTTECTTNVWTEFVASRHLIEYRASWTLDGEISVEWTCRCPAHAK